MTGPWKEEGGAAAITGDYLDHRLDNKDHKARQPVPQGRLSQRPSLDAAPANSSDAQKVN